MRDSQAGPGASNTASTSGCALSPPPPPSAPQRPDPFSSAAGSSWASSASGPATARPAARRPSASLGGAMVPRAAAHASSYASRAPLGWPGWTPGRVGATSLGTNWVDGVGWWGGRASPARRPATHRWPATVELRTGGSTALARPLPAIPSTRIPLPSHPPPPTRPDSDTPCRSREQPAWKRWPAWAPPPARPASRLAAGCRRPPPPWRRSARLATGRASAGHDHAARWTANNGRRLPPPEVFHARTLHGRGGWKGAEKRAVCGQATGR